jgi:tRNA threonylcarbamoyl adenosine modification protein YeaZ
MITLALDTSSPVGSVAAFDGDRLLGEQTFTRDGLFAALENLVGTAAPSRPRSTPGGALGTSRPTDFFDRIIVGVGPGSFTGIRAGIAAAKGLALPRRLPVIGVSSYDAIALAVAPEMPKDCELICVLGDARRGDIYCALYERTGCRQGEIHLTQIPKLADVIHDPVWFVSSEIEMFKAELKETLGGFASVCPHPICPRASLLPKLLRQQFPLEPLYLRTAEYKKAT